jgi:hypothetical protein
MLPAMTNDGFRRISPVAECFHQGPLTESAADARRRPPEHLGTMTQTARQDCAQQQFAYRRARLCRLALFIPSLSGHAAVVASTSSRSRIRSSAVSSPINRHMSALRRDLQKETVDRLEQLDEVAQVVRYGRINFYWPDRWLMDEPGLKFSQLSLGV